MILQPSSLDDLRRQLAGAQATEGQVTGFRLDALNRVIEYTPEDMTITVEAGMTLAALQKKLSEHGQWLPLDPPHPERATLGAILAANRSGPRRYGYGTIRDYLIGMRVALADGAVIKSGGRVVKNVAGFDLCKLLIGSHGTLGVIVEATFKVRPLPEVERFLGSHCDSLAQAESLLTLTLNSDVTPVVLDLHNLVKNGAQAADSFSLVIGFDGMREDVDWQVTEVEKLGSCGPSDLEHHARFHDGESKEPIHRCAVLPTRLGDFIRGLGKVAFVARAGNGGVAYRGGPPPPVHELPVALMRRVKDTCDPKHLFVIPGVSEKFPLGMTGDKNASPSAGGDSSLPS